MMNMVRKSGLFLIGVLFLACAGSPAPAGARSADELNAAIRETSDYFNQQLPAGNKLVILNIQSELPALSEYIIDELIANTVNDRVFPVVDRQQLDVIRGELDFQTSGEVDDDTAQELGRMAGAQIIVSGALSKVGDLYRLRVRALSVQTAQIEGQFNRNISDSRMIAALAQSRATGYGDSGGQPAARSSAQVAAQPARVAQPAQAAATAPVAAAAPATIYKVGDTGPAGGIIFFDKGLFMDGWQYLEAALADFPGTWQWSSNNTGVDGTSTGIGNGRRNTVLIVAALNKSGETGQAAQLCGAYTYGGYSDWFLPSKDELNLMYINLAKKDLGDFSPDWYWSSSDSHTLWGNNAWWQNFLNGEQTNGSINAPKRNAYYVRAIRQF